MEDRVEVVGALRLPLGGLNGYLGVRGKQGRKQDKYQGTTPNKTRRTKLFLTPRDAAVALAELKERPQVDPDDPIKHIDFSSPAILPAAPAALRLSVLAACGVLPLRPELEPQGCACEQIVHVGMPLTEAQSRAAFSCGMQFVQAFPHM